MKFKRYIVPHSDGALTSDLAADSQNDLHIVWANNSPYGQMYAEYQLPEPQPCLVENAVCSQQVSTQSILEAMRPKVQVSPANGDIVRVLAAPDSGPGKMSYLEIRREGKWLPRIILGAGYDIGLDVDGKGFIHVVMRGSALNYFKFDPSGNPVLKVPNIAEGYEPTVMARKDGSGALSAYSRTTANRLANLYNTQVNAQGQAAPEMGIITGGGVSHPIVVADPSGKPAYTYQFAVNGKHEARILLDGKEQSVSNGHDAYNPDLAFNGNEPVVVFHAKNIFGIWTTYLAYKGKIYSAGLGSFARVAVSQQLAAVIFRHTIAGVIDLRLAYATLAGV